MAKGKVTFLVAMKAPEVARNNVLLFDIKVSSKTCNKTDKTIKIESYRKRKQTTLPDWLNKQIIIIKCKMIFDVDIHLSWCHVWDQCENIMQKLFPI